MTPVELRDRVHTRDFYVSRFRVGIWEVRGGGGDQDPRVSRCLLSGSFPQTIITGYGQRTLEIGDPREQNKKRRGTILLLPSIDHCPGSAGPTPG